MASALRVPFLFHHRTRVTVTPRLHAAKGRKHTSVEDLDGIQSEKGTK